MKNFDDMTVSILGSTGSVGSQAVEVAEELGVRVQLLSANRSWQELALQAEHLHPKVLAVGDAESAELLLRATDGRYRIVFGDDGLENAVAELRNDVIVHSIAGLAGTRAALAAARTGARLAMANKEAIIVAGDLIRRELEHSGGMLIPVDSEHSAIFQCLRCGGAAEPESVSRIILTASGGPFYGRTRDDLRAVTPEMALAHPTWRMGRKITVDSATLMNKGFEVIEACRLFEVSPESVDVIVHRQSIVHSMVEYIDGSVIAQLAAPDMRSCIRYAISYPHRAAVSEGHLDFARIASLTFDRPDTETFPCLALAYDAANIGGTAPASLIAADEEAVEAFLCGRIGFCDIADAVRETLCRVVPRPADTLCAIDEAVSETRDAARLIIDVMARNRQ